MAAPENGTNIGIYIGGTKVAGATSASISTTDGLRDATSKDSAGWAESCSALREWSIEGEGFFDFASAYGYNELFGVMQARTAVTVRFSTETTTEEYHEGTAFISDISADAPVEDSSTFSFSLTGSGPLNHKALT